MCWIKTRQRVLCAGVYYTRETGRQTDKQTDRKQERQRERETRQTSPSCRMIGEEPTDAQRRNIHYVLLERPHLYPSSNTPPLVGYLVCFQNENVQLLYLCLSIGVKSTAHYRETSIRWWAMNTRKPLQRRFANDMAEWIPSRTSEAIMTGNVRFAST